MLGNFLASVQIWMEYFTSVNGCLQPSWGSKFRGNNLEKSLHVQKLNFLANTGYPCGIRY